MADARIRLAIDAMVRDARQRAADGDEDLRDAMNRLRMFELWDVVAAVLRAIDNGDVPSDG